jgi:hypothetical protein
MIQKLVQTLRSICLFDSESYWPNSDNKALFVINNCLNSTLNLWPYEFVFNFTPSCHLGEKVMVPCSLDEIHKKVLSLRVRFNMNLSFRINSSRRSLSGFKVCAYVLVSSCN